MRNLLIVIGALVIASPAQAQGNLSVQGFGYPAGGFSTRALATGGAIGEFDPQSVLNPAVIGGSGSASLFVQYDPEFRTVDTESGSDRTTTARFPLVGATLPLGQRYSLGISSTSFLDRSSATRFRTTQTIGTEAVSGTEVFRTLGGINDIRLALAMNLRSGFRFGVAGHAFTGQNRVSSAIAFDDTAAFLPLLQSSTLDYSGTAFSGGAEWRPSSVLGLAVSGRKGGDITVSSNDTTVGRARVPDRYSASALYTGITGLSLAARAGRELWSSLDGLGTARVSTHDAWDFSGGAEGAGPRIGSRVISLRLGARYRGLPFGVAGDPVNEFSFGGGFGVAFARDRAALDFAALRSSRSTASMAGRGGVDEKAFTISVGLRVRP